MSDVLPFDVSRETIERLRIFERLVLKWTSKINLISKSAQDNIWDRHIVDSMQLYPIAPSEGKWVDLGSGAGFPGVVMAILSSQDGLKHSFVFVESDQRKAVFLRTAVRELDLKAVVMTDRIESIPCLGADIISARALSDLTQLLEFCQRHLKPAGAGIFPKGENWKKEHEEAQQMWSYSCDAITSFTNPRAAILKIKDLERV